MHVFLSFLTERIIQLLRHCFRKVHSPRQSRITLYEKIRGFSIFTLKSAYKAHNDSIFNCLCAKHRVKSNNECASKLLLDLRKRCSLCCTPYSAIRWNQWTTCSTKGWSVLGVIVGSKIIRTLAIIHVIFLWFHCQFLASWACYKQYKA